MRQQATSTFLRLGLRVFGSSSHHSGSIAATKGLAWSRRVELKLVECPVQFHGFKLAQAAGFASKVNNVNDGKLNASEKEKVGNDGKLDKEVGVEQGKGEKENEKKPEEEEESQEQKLVKEVNKLEQLLREKDSLLEEKEDMIKELKNKVLRSYAELENFRERARKEAESNRKFSIQAFSKALLDVADNLERALAAVPDDYASKDPEEMKKLFQTMVEGVKMTEKQLVQVFKKYGVERFDPAGQPFDPNVHLAICQVTDPSKSPGTVANVFMPGYMLHERVLRPAEVSVVRAAEA